MLFASTLGVLLASMRREVPLVQCITNYVAMDIAANVLLAAGASPAMIHTKEESAQFAATAAALTINIGTLSPLWVEGMYAAAKAAHQLGKPWVLDPVAHFVSPFRREVVAELLSLKPTVIRGNASEIIALAGEDGHGYGVDSGAHVTAAEEGAKILAHTYKTIIAVTGEFDFVTDGTRALRISGGSPFMKQVTALGCSLTGLIGAFAAISPHDVFKATVAALALFAVAGEHAARRAAGPGSFRWHFLDALGAIQPDMLEKEARIISL